MRRWIWRALLICPYAALYYAAPADELFACWFCTAFIYAAAYSFMAVGSNENR